MTESVEVGQLAYVRDSSRTATLGCPAQYQHGLPGQPRVAVLRMRHDGGRSDEESIRQIETRRRFSFGCDAGIRDRRMGVPAVSRGSARLIARGESDRDFGAESAAI